MWLQESYSVTCDSWLPWRSVESNAASECVIKAEKIHHTSPDHGAVMTVSNPLSFQHFFDVYFCPEGYTLKPVWKWFIEGIENLSPLSTVLVAIMMMLKPLTDVCSLVSKLFFTLRVKQNQNSYQMLRFKFKSLILSKGECGSFHCHILFKRFFTFS